MPQTFTQAYKGENAGLGAAMAAAQPGPVAPVAGVAERFFNNLETASRYVKAMDALQFLRSQGANGVATAAKLQQLITKAVGIGDIGAVRLVSLSTEVSKTFNTDTVFLNLIQGRRLNTVTDFTHGWREDDFGAGTLDSMVFDPNGAPPEDNGGQTRRTNTLAAIGGTINVGIVSNEMIKKRGFMDELDRQVSDKLVKVKRSTNRQMLQATENANGPVFNMGGLVTRTTSNVVTPGGGATHVATADIDTVITDIITAIGVHELAMLATVDAAKTLNDKLQTQFPGDRIEDFFKATDAQARMATIYYSPQVGPLPVYLDLQMPANTLEIFAPEYVRPNGFTIGDVAGPWVIALAQTGMSEPKVVFDLLTLEDRVLNSRGKITNIL